MTAHDLRLPTPEQMARELWGTTVRVFADDRAEAKLEAFLEERSRAADRNPLRSTVEWLCPVSLTIYEFDSRVCHAQGPHGDLATAEEPEVAYIISALRDGEYDDARQGMLEFFDDSVQIPDDRIIAAWSARDGVRLAHAELFKPDDDAEARHLAADITACRDLATTVELELIVEKYLPDLLSGLQKALSSARDAAGYMPLMIDIADDIRAVIDDIIEQRSAPQDALREIISEINSVRAEMIANLARRRSQLRRERETLSL